MILRIPVGGPSPILAFTLAHGMAPLEFLSDLGLGLAHYRLPIDTALLDQVAF